MEAWMAAAITALYVYDCAVLLHWNEALLATPWKGKWIPLFGSRTFTLQGKEVCLASALLPAVPVFRLGWSPESPGADDGDWERFADALRPIQWCALAVFVTTNVLFPVALLLRVGDDALLILLALVYASLVGTLILVWLRRTPLALTGRRFASLAFEVLACPPFGANIARRLSLARPVREDLVFAARRLLAERQIPETFSEIKVRLHDEMETEEAGSERQARLRTREAQLQ